MSALKRCKEDPVYFCRKVLGVEPWERQQDILYSVRDNKQTCVVSANGMGKSHVTAAAALWFLMTRKNAVVLTTAPTWRQVTSILWAEIGNMHAKARVALGGELTTGKLQIAPKWYALGLPSSEEVRFQGFRERELLICFDEAAGIEPCIYTAAQGCLTLDNHRFLIIGNPTSPTGMFYEASRSPSWNTIYLSALDAPSERYPYLPSKAWCEERRKEWGEESPMYQARVLGRFPTEGDDTLIPLAWLHAAARRYEERSSKELLVSEHMYLGVDVARFGKDQTVVAPYQPNKVLPLKKVQGRDTVQVTQLVVQEALGAGMRLQTIAIDDGSMGGGVVDQVRSLGYPVVGAVFQSGAKNQRFFRKLRDEMAWNAREVFRAGDIAIPPDDQLINQLASIKYAVDADGFIKIESKDQMIARGLCSPDCAWAVILALWASRRMRRPMSIDKGRQRAAREPVRNDRVWY